MSCGLLCSQVSEQARVGHILSDKYAAGAGLVTVPKSWAAEHSLPTSKENPSNTSDAVYFTAVYHQLHCLV